MLLVRLPADSSLFIVKLWGSQELYMNLRLLEWGRSAPLIPVLLKGQL